MFPTASMPLRPGARIKLEEAKRRCSPLTRTQIWASEHRGKEWECPSRVACAPALVLAAFAPLGGRQRVLLLNRHRLRERWVPVRRWGLHWHRGMLLVCGWHVRYRWWRGE